VGLAVSFCLDCEPISGGQTKVVFMANIKETKIIQRLQAVALDIRSLRRPKLSMKKYGLNVGRQRFARQSPSHTTHSHETRKYCTPRTPEIISDVWVERPMLRSNVIGKK